MHIKFIILEGFRSYRARTVLGPLDPGLNAIIGRNGAGKSNFFVGIELMFSKEYQNLRPEARAALIYSGPDRTLGATVEIIFHNEDRRFPVDNDEVSILRNIMPKEDAFFLDHKRVSNRRDIAEMLETAGLSISNPYNVVKQGQISFFTTCSDKQRLEIVEKLAGVGSYDLKKKKNRDLLEQIERSNECISEQLNELKESTDSLGEEKKRYKTYIKLKKKRDRIQNQLFSMEMKKIREEESVLREAFENEQCSTNLKQVVEDIQGMEEEESEYSRQYSRQKGILKEAERDKDQELKAEERLARQLERTNYQIQDLEASQHIDVSGEIAAAHREKIGLDQELETSKKNLTELEAARDEVAGSREGLINRANWIRSKQNHKTKFGTVAERDSWLDKEIGTLESDRKDNRVQLEQLGLEENQRKEELTALKDEQAQLNLELVDYEQRMKRAEERQAEMLENQNKIDTEFSVLESRVRNGRFDAQQKEDEAAGMLREVASNREVTSLIIGHQSIQQVLEAGDNRVRDGYYGLLVDLFTARDGFEDVLAIPVNEVAGTKLLYHVVQSREIASYLIKQCNRRKLPGQFKFLPLDSLRPRRMAAYSAREGLELMLSTLEYQAEVDIVMKFVFGGWVLCRDLDAARDAKPDLPGYDFMSVEGDRLESKGVMKGGYVNRNNMYSKYLAYRTKREKIDEKRRKKEDEENRLRQIDNTRLDIHNKVERQENESSKLREHIGFINSDLRVLDGRKEALVNQLSMLQATIKKKAQEEDVLKGKIKDYTKEKSSKMSSSLNASDQQLLKNLDKEIKALTVQSWERSKQAAFISKDISEKETRLAVEVNPRLADLQQRRDGIDTAAIQRRKLEIEAQQLASQLERVKANLVKLRGKEDQQGHLKQLRTALDKVQSKIAKAKETRNQWAAKVATYEEGKLRLEKKIHVLRQNYPRENDDGDHEVQESHVSKRSLHKELDNIKKKMLDMEPVDEIAVLNLEDNLKEIDSLQVELDHNISDVNELLDTIKMLEEKKAEQISYTVLQVQRYFNATFSSLVAGGLSELSLNLDRVDDEQNIENVTGLGINVSFTGNQRKMKSLSSLSGGQKAVVSISFILALQKCDPAPFYLFDEVDAALDPEVRQVIANHMVAQTDHAQFIVTSFRKELVSVSHKIFGVINTNDTSRVEQITRERALDFIQDANNQ